MTQRDRIVLIVVGLVVALAASWFLLVSPKRQEASKLAGDIVTAQAARDQATQEAATADAARQAYAKDYATVAGLGKAVPTTDDTPSLVYQLQAAAKRAGIDFRSLQIDTSATAASAPATGTAAATAAASSTPSAKAPAPAATAAAPVPNGGGITRIPVTLSFDGKYEAMRRFLSLIRGFASETPTKLDVSGRFLTIDGISFSQGLQGFPSIKASVVATAFQAPLEDPIGGSGAGAQGSTTTPAGGQPATQTAASGTSASTAQPSTGAKNG